MDDRDLQPVRRRVLACLEPRRDVLAAYLFGSVAQGRARPDSDIDVAVLVSKDVIRQTAWEYRLDLISELTAILKRDDVDLVILNEAPPLLAHRVLSKSELIFERSASARVAFQVRTVNRYLDSQSMRNMYLEYLKKQVREDQVLG